MDAARVHRAGAGHRAVAHPGRARHEPADDSHAAAGRWRAAQRRGGGVVSAARTACARASRPASTSCRRRRARRRSWRCSRRARWCSSSSRWSRARPSQDFLDALAQHPRVQHTLRGKSADAVMAALGHPGERPEGRVLSRHLPLRGARPPDAGHPRARLRQHAEGARERLGGAPRRSAVRDALPGADPRLDGREGGGAARASGRSSPGCSSTACARACACSPTRR